jgi:hypothetical protein
MKTSAISICLLVHLGGMSVDEQRDAVIVTGHKGDTRAAYELGIAEADKEIQEGKATIYTYGLRRHPEFIDRETGLPYEIIAGCVVDRELLARARGHNDTIRKYIEGRGLPNKSFKRWDKELFDLKGYYETRIKTHQPQPLTAGHSAAKSPDARYAIRLVKTQLRSDASSVADALSVVVSSHDVDRKPVVVCFDGNVDFVWGPKGSGFAVIRCSKRGLRSFMALDLNRGKSLREESASEQDDRKESQPINEKLKPITWEGVQSLESLATGHPLPDL